MVSSSRMKRRELDERFAIWKEVLDFRTADEWGTDPHPSWDSSQLGGVLDSFRDLVYAMSLPIINTNFASEFAAKFPNFRFSGGRRVHSIADFVEFVHNYNPADPKAMDIKIFRAMVHFCLYAMWGKSNRWAVTGENQILKLLQFRYDGNRMCDGTVKKRNHRGGFIKTILVKKLDMERGKLNDAWERVTLERFFYRDVFKPKQKTEDQSEGTAKKADKSHLRKYLVFCDAVKDGFKGGYILLEGHPQRKIIDGKSNVCKTPEITEAEKKERVIAQLASKLRKRSLSEIRDIMSGGDGDEDEDDDVDPLISVMRRLDYGDVNTGGAKVEIPSTKPIQGPPPNKRRRTSSDGSSSTASNSKSDDDAMAMEVPVGESHDAAVHMSVAVRNDPHNNDDDLANAVDLNEAAKDLGYHPFSVSKHMSYA